MAESGTEDRLDAVFAMENVALERLQERQERVMLLVQLGEKKNPFCGRPSWHIMTPYAQTTLPEE